MTCSESFSKIILSIINSIFLLASLLMLSIGIAIVVSPDSTLSFASSFGIDFHVLSDASGGFFASIIKASGIFMIVLGGVVAIIGFFGFFGVCCDNKCMLTTYAIVMSVIVMAEVALIIFAAAYPKVFLDTGTDAVHEALTTGFKSDIPVSDEGKLLNATLLNPIDLAWLTMQFKLNCCGATNYTDYAKFPWTKCGNICSQGKIPISCCSLKNPAKFPQSSLDFKSVDKCQDSSPQSGFFNENGCAETMIGSVRDFILKYSKIAIGIAAGIIGLEIILIIMSCMLCCRSGGSKYR